jgi:hypothetical protein
VKKHLKILSQPLESMTNYDKFVAKSSTHYECKNCDYITSRKSNFEKHINTIKHNELQNDDNGKIKGSKALLVCICGKSFNHRQNLWSHKKRCIFIENKCDKDVNKNDLIKQIMLQNQQLLFDNQEFKTMILDIVSKPPTTINNNTNCNNNNKQFNLNVFLNEKCKNAMNMSDFIGSLEILDEDFENIGKLGYVQGISNIFIKGLKELDETMRPLHCNDLKRETLYIKDNDVWNKDDNKQKIRNAIALIAHKNFKYIPIWIEANPQALDGTTKTNDQYMRIANQVTTAITPDDDLGINKIIRNVASNVIIDKK